MKFREFIAVTRCAVAIQKQLSPHSNLPLDRDTSARNKAQRLIVRRDHRRLVGFANRAIAAARAWQQFRQLRDIGRDAPRFVSGQSAG